MATVSRPVCELALCTLALFVPFSLLNLRLWVLAPLWGLLSLCSWHNAVPSPGASRCPCGAAVNQTPWRSPRGEEIRVMHLCGRHTRGIDGIWEFLLGKTPAVLEEQENYCGPGPACLPLVPVLHKASFCTSNAIHAQQKVQPETSQRS